MRNGLKHLGTLHHIKESCVRLRIFSLAVTLLQTFFFSEKLGLLWKSGNFISQKKMSLQEWRERSWLSKQHTLSLTSSLFKIFHPNLRGKRETVTEGGLTEDHWKPHSLNSRQGGSLGQQQQKRVFLKGELESEGMNGDFLSVSFGNLWTLGTKLVKVQFSIYLFIFNRIYWGYIG